MMISAMTMMPAVTPVVMPGFSLSFSRMPTGVSLAKCCVDGAELGLGSEPHSQRLFLEVKDRTDRSKSLITNIGADNSLTRNSHPKGCHKPGGVRVVFHAPSI